MSEAEDFEARKEQILAFRNRVLDELTKIAQNKELSMEIRNRASAMKEYATRAVIRSYPGKALAASGSSMLLGQNVKFVEYNPSTGRSRFVGPNIISLPQYHLFHKNKLTGRGAMTMMHELGHGIAHNEVRADLIAAELGLRLGISKKVIEHSMKGREAVLGPENYRRVMESIRESKPREGAEAPLLARRRPATVMPVKPQAPRPRPKRRRLAA